jgi:hypothetical protein
MTNQPSNGRYPLLESILAEKGLKLKGTYTYADAVQILGGSKRSLLDRIRDGKLRARDLPAHARFLSIDLEEFLQGSIRVQDGVTQPE